MQESRLLSKFFKECPKIFIYLFSLFFINILFFSVKEIAAISIMAASLSEEDNALLCFIKTIFLIVLSQLVWAMGKFALIFVRAISILDKFFAKLKFLFVRKERQCLGLLISRRIRWISRSGVNFVTLSNPF